jgi:hypothetical protein
MSPALFQSGPVVLEAVILTLVEFGRAPLRP